MPCKTMEVKKTHFQIYIGFVPFLLKAWGKNCKWLNQPKWMQRFCLTNILIYNILKKTIFNILIFDTLVWYNSVFNCSPLFRQIIYAKWEGNRFCCLFSMNKTSKKYVPHSPSPVWIFTFLSRHVSRFLWKSIGTAAELLILLCVGQHPVNVTNNYNVKKR